MTLVKSLYKTVLTSGYIYYRHAEDNITSLQHILVQPLPSRHVQDTDQGKLNNRNSFLCIFNLSLYNSSINVIFFLRRCDLSTSNVV
jgi:hypothetical protein